MWRNAVPYLSGSETYFNVNRCAINGCNTSKYFSFCISFVLLDPHGYECIWRIQKWYPQIFIKIIKFISTDPNHSMVTRKSRRNITAWDNTLIKKVMQFILKKTSYKEDSRFKHKQRNIDISITLIKTIIWHTLPSKFYNLKGICGISVLKFYLIWNWLHIYMLCILKLM